METAKSTLQGPADRVLFCPGRALKIGKFMRKSRLIMVADTCIPRTQDETERLCSLGYGANHKPDWAIQEDLSSKTNINKQTNKPDLLFWTNKDIWWQHGHVSLASEVELEVLLRLGGSHSFLVLLIKTFCSIPRIPVTSLILSAAPEEWKH